MAKHHSVKSFSEAHPAYSPASIRNTIFKRGPELEKAGAIFHAGRKVVIVEEPFLNVISGDGRKPAKQKSPSSERVSA